ncbi:MAG: PHP domain-containing protein [Magnetococcales bacterium]|nr:PHP domain-containing protein [Magnetococcales bacterium]MBF0322781.1 PHP domain-containing protein [Magnetococcales bacterium]
MRPHLREDFFLQTTRLATPLPAWEYHVHSTHSDGSALASEVIRYAVGAGIKRIIFTEHTEDELVGSGDWFSRYVEEMRRLQAQWSGVIDIRLGLEVPVMDFAGTLDLTDHMLREADFILGAVHAFPEGDWRTGYRNPAQAVDVEFRASMGLLENPLVDAIAHPGGVCNRYISSFPMELFEAIVIRAAERRIAVELNPAYHEPMRPYLDICRRHGAMISPGSNAHDPVQIGDAVRVLESVLISDQP